jgi:hypothetical protein
MNVLKNIIKKIAIFVLHTFLSTIMLTLVLCVYLLINSSFTSIIYPIVPHAVLIHPIVILLFPILHIISIVWFYKTKKFLLFALPLSHLVFGFLFVYITSLILQHSGACMSEAVGVLFIAILYFLPAAVITFIISLVIKTTKWKREKPKTPPSRFINTIKHFIVLKFK